MSLWSTKSGGEKI